MTPESNLNLKKAEELIECQICYIKFVDDDYMLIVVQGIEYTIAVTWRPK